MQARAFHPADDAGKVSHTARPDPPPRMPENVTLPYRSENWTHNRKFYAYLMKS